MDFGRRSTFEDARRVARQEQRAKSARIRASEAAEARRCNLMRERIAVIAGKFGARQFELGSAAEPALYLPVAVPDLSAASRLTKLAKGRHAFGLSRPSTIDSGGILTRGMFSVARDTRLVIGELTPAITVPDMGYTIRGATEPLLLTPGGYFGRKLPQVHVLSHYTVDQEPLKHWGISHPDKHNADGVLMLGSAKEFSQAEDPEALYTALAGLANVLEVHDIQEERNLGLISGPVEL